MNEGLKNPAASVRARLLNYARDHADDFQRVLTRHAIERLLFRLSRSADADRFVLKGAMLFATWPENAFRPTGDLDLLGKGNPDPEEIADIFRRICVVVVPEDGIVYDGGSVRVDPVREADKYQGARIRLEGRLDSAIITVQVDIGFGDRVHPEPELREFPTLLPDQLKPRVLMYPPETVVAEKFEAMIRFGEANGRIKDFYDLWLTTRIFPFDMPTLVDAVSGTLRRRETAFPTQMPVGLTDAFATIAAERGFWAGFLRRTPPALEPPNFPQLQAELRRFFGPVVAALAAPEGARGQWSPDKGAWG